MYFAKYFLENYNFNEEIRYLLDNRMIILYPMVYKKKNDYINNFINFRLMLMDIIKIKE